MISQMHTERVLLTFSKMFMIREKIVPPLRMKMESRVILRRQDRVGK